MEFILYPERPLLNIDYLSSFTEGVFLRFKEYTDELVYGTPRGEHITDLAERLSMPEPAQYPVRLDLKVGVPVQFSDDTMKSKSMMVSLGLEPISLMKNGKASLEESNP